MVLSHEEKVAEWAWAQAIDIEDLERMDWDGVYETHDGCQVEPDGKCEHGYSSPLLLLGMI